MHPRGVGRTGAEPSRRPRAAGGSRLSRSTEAAAPDAPFGVYVHIPFCARRCDYCAFATWDDRAHLVEAYLDAVLAELESVRRVGVLAATSVFVGGGTPSSVPPARLVGILDAIERVPGAEVTVECNPDTITAALLDTYLEGGVTRISLGVQSLVPHVLAGLGRTHDPATVGDAVRLVAERGFESWNADVIYGGAGESLDDWARTVDALLELDPPHVSAYALTVEAGTPLAADPARHPQDDDLADKYELVTERFAAAGLEWYEISNWSRPGHQCRHNRLYWAQGDYVGVGCAAHSHRGGRRWWNVRSLERYLDRLAAGEPAEAGAESLDESARALEALQLSLRTDDGVPAAALASLLAEPDDPRHGLVEVRGDRVVLRREGRLLADQVALALEAPDQRTWSSDGSTTT